MDEADFDRLISQTAALANAPRPRPRVEKLISRGKPRIRRDATFPIRNFSFTPDKWFTLEKWHTYRREIHDSYELAWCWTRRREMMSDDEDLGGITYRALLGAIRVFPTGEWVGAIELEEYRCFFDRHSFFATMDECSFETASLGGVIAGLFTDDEFAVLTDQGTILYWKSAWMHPDHARGAVWAKLTNPIIDRMRGWSILILKAFPLEYQDGGSAKGFKQRLAAMMKYYEKVIGVEPILRKRSRYGNPGFSRASGSSGMPEEGWMLCWSPRIYDVVEQNGDPKVIYPVRYGLTEINSEARKAHR